MSEYWKSVPRKFCDFCKCWITDNRPSVDFHERGKRHKENVELRLKEVRKKSIKDSYDKEQLDKEMEKMEKAALEAFKKDLKDNPDLAKQYGVSLEPKPKPKEEISSTSNTTTTDESKAEKRKLPEVKEWYEAVSDEGYTYYWSTVTGASVWEAPEEYLSLAEQEKTKKAKTDSEEAGGSNAVEDNQVTSDEVDTSTKVTTHMDPSFSRSAFGAWSVVREEKQEQLYDESSAPPELEEIPMPQENIVKSKPEKPKFKEKTVASLGMSHNGPVAFKKRKIASGARNARQKGNDD